MFDVIFNAIKGEVANEHFPAIVNTIMTLIGHFEDEYVKDKNARNAAIDAIVQLLQAQKQ